MIFLNIVLYILLFLLWIFLVLLALLILLIIMPIRYRVEGTVGSQTEVTAKVNWFFSLFRILYTYTSTESALSIKIGPYKLPPDFLFDSKSDEKEEEKGDFAIGFSGVKLLLTNLDIKSIISLVIILMKKLCRKIMPKHLLVRGVVGFSDPCSTGQFIGFYEAAAGAADIRSAIDLQGDFNQKNLELDLQLAGRFAIASLIGPFIWFVWQRPVRDGIKIIKNNINRS